MRSFALILTLSLTLACCRAPVRVVYRPAPDAATIVRWIDGDTCEVAIDSGDGMTWHERVRIWGVDTPERGDAGYDEATEASRQQWPPGTHVTLVYPETNRDGSMRWRDNFGRLLAVLR